MAGVADNHEESALPLKLERYYGYVVAMALKQYRAMSGELRSRIDLADLIQDGYVGLVEASRRFDSAKGFTFLTFAHYRIVGEMTQSRQKAARLPARMDDLAFGPDPDGQEDPQATGEIPASDPNPVQELARKRLIEELRSAVESLNTDEQALVRERFVQERTLQEIADELGLAVATVFARVQKVLEKIRHRLIGRGYTVADLPDHSPGNWLVSPRASAREGMSS
ncbi:sigma-70 family RNA polymerase sigma factor [bacterium]|nr:sigma-70 family RNA polymerase sigma factor [bacterium]